MYKAVKSTNFNTTSVFIKREEILTDEEDEVFQYNFCFY